MAKRKLDETKDGHSTPVETAEVGPVQEAPGPSATQEALGPSATPSEGPSARENVLLKALSLVCNQGVSKDAARAALQATGTDHAESSDVGVAVE